MNGNCEAIKAAIVSGSPIQAERWSCTEEELSLIEQSLVQERLHRAWLVRENIRALRRKPEPKAEELAAAEPKVPEPGAAEPKVPEPEVPEPGAAEPEVPEPGPTTD